MLVLSRKIGTRIVVDGPAVIEIVEIRGDKVRLGVTAPNTTTIDREEIAVLRAANPVVGEPLDLERH